MRVVIVCHSMRSDRNHGNAHVLRGVARELQTRGHEVVAFEPENGWSAAHLAAEAGPLLSRISRDLPALALR